MKSVTALTAFICMALKLTEAQSATQVDLSFQGLNLLRFGGDITDVKFSLSIPDPAIDKEPPPYVYVYDAIANISLNGENYSSYGYLQLRPSTYQRESWATITVKFPNEQFPGTHLNMQISGIELTLIDHSGAMIQSENLIDLKSNFAENISSFSYALRLGGWATDTGKFQEYTSDSLATAHFTSQITSSVDEPPYISLFAAGLLFTTLSRRKIITNAG